MESDGQHPNPVSFYSALLKVVCGLGGAAAVFAWSVPLLLAGFGMAAGAGHGTTFFLMAMAPPGLRLWIWPTIGFLLAFRNSRVAAWTAALLLAYAYAFAAWYAIYSPMDQLPSDMNRLWQNFSRSFVAYAVWYLIGQVTFWALILTAGRKKAKTGTSTT